MNEMQLKVAAGGMLHDIGKILYRAKDGRNHSQSGYEFLKNEAGIADKDNLDQVHYHHASLLSHAKLPEDSLAYITYMADNIAAAADRRENDQAESGFEKMMALESVFNILNGNDGKARYRTGTMRRTDGINYPDEAAVSYNEVFYKKVVDDMQDILKQMTYSNGFINSLLEVMEANLSFIPSSTARQERADISLYDHVKMTAAVGSCIYAYFEAIGERDYKKRLFTNGKLFYAEKAFLLFGMDISGIQSFIYNIQSKNALKNLRARSFYLEILMENMVDELCGACGVSRANLIYVGGGHAYLLLPNTEAAKAQIDQFVLKMNAWFLERFQTELYIGTGYAACSANDLKNAESGSYRSLFVEVSSKISEHKVKRYSGKQIAYLNHMTRDSGERECRICHRSDHLVGERHDICEICQNLIDLSKGIQEKSFFAVADDTSVSKGLPIASGQYLSALDGRALRQIMAKDGYVRSYCKNEMYTGYEIATKLWVGDYKYADTFEELVKGSRGIKRLGVLRADIDNLGQAFVRGFESEKYGERYVTLSRTATFSRKLSLFFKLHINEILEKGIYSLEGKKPGKRRAAIVYSGGDDVFIVGAWADILEFAIDLYHSLKRYSQDTLTISAGFGLYPVSFPISAMADETGELEEAAKHIDDKTKNAIALFEQKTTYHWDTLIDEVLGEKFKLIYDFFESEDNLERGKNFLYNMLDLLRQRHNRINIARLAYLLARLEPRKDAAVSQIQLYKHFAEKMYQWALNDYDADQTITALYIYVYLKRQGEDENETE